MGRHDHGNYESDSMEEDKRLKRKRKHHKSSRKRDDPKHGRKDESQRLRRTLNEEGSFASSSSSSSSSDSSRARRKDRRRRKKEKKRRKKLDKRDTKHAKDKQRRSRKSSKQRHDDRDENDDGGTNLLQLERNHQFASALKSLLELQPGMASELPVLLIRMAEGTSFNLSQMPDARVSTSLQHVLASLSPFGVQRDEVGSWSWDIPSSGGRKDPLVLLKVARTLLDQIGITLEAVRAYEKEKEASQKAAMQKETHALELSNALTQQTDSLLQQFRNETQSAEAGPTLAQELATLCNMILTGESISLDGLADAGLRDAIEGLFRAAGLEKSEMEDSDDSQEGDSEEECEPVMGYSLPEDNKDGRAMANMTSILEVCKARAIAGNAPKRSVKGPMLPPKDFDATNHRMLVEEDDEEGPAPVGSDKATRRVQKGPSLPPEVIKAMADRRKRELAVATGLDDKEQAGDGEREQWMLEPGEHDLLQGIKTGNAMKSRGFENKKKRPSAMEAGAAPMDPSVQAEVDAIMELQRDARGPSLMDQHRMKKAEEKEAAAKGGKQQWKWSRDKDLDDGRRVDKNALNMVMGGAADNLKDKFHGGLSRGFM